MPLHEYIDTKATHPRQRITKIEIQAFVEPLFLIVREDFKNQALARFRRNTLVTLSLHLSVDSQEWG